MFPKISHNDHTDNYDTPNWGIFKPWARSLRRTITQSYSPSKSCPAFMRILNVFPKIRFLGELYSHWSPDTLTLAEVSSNAEHNLCGEQQHHHLPRPRRHHVQPHQHQQGENGNFLVFTKKPSLIYKKVFQYLQKALPDLQKSSNIYKKSSHQEKGRLGTLLDVDC